ncbi:MAG: hypothetical protein OXE52_11025 [Chloroflexi bacterium]|nr:hypothetical protein [Chloroflexota bacterium]
MDLNYVALISVLVALLLIMIQRAERARRRLVAGFVLICLLIIRHNAFIKDDLHDETLLAFVLGLILSALFWLLVGKYNPPGNSDEIRVIGMDD